MARDLTGQKFERLTVIEKDTNATGNNKKWICKCDCGNIKSVYETHLVRGNTRSCGCLLKEVSSQYEDLVGQKFGRLTVIEHVCLPNTKRKHHWKCKCDCGNELIVASGHLKSGHTQSCGCLQRERTSEACFKHGEKRTRLYNVWSHMKSRCYDKNDAKYYRYGARGITVCDEWNNSYIAFRDWALAHGYREDLSIDRIDNNGNYCPGNCRWADTYTQMNNMSTNRRITINEETHTAAEWDRIMGHGYECVAGRLALGWSEYDAVMKPQRKSRKKHI